MQIDLKNTLVEKMNGQFKYMYIVYKNDSFYFNIKVVFQNILSYNLTCMYNAISKTRKKPRNILGLHFQYVVKYCINLMHIPVEVHVTCILVRHVCFKFNLNLRI